MGRIVSDYCGMGNESFVIYIQDCREDYGGLLRERKSRGEMMALKN